MPSPQNNAGYRASRRSRRHDLPGRFVVVNGKEAGLCPSCRWYVVYEPGEGNPRKESRMVGVERLSDAAELMRDAARGCNAADFGQNYGGPNSLRITG